MRHAARGQPAANSGWLTCGQAAAHAAQKKLWYLLPGNARDPHTICRAGRSAAYAVALQLKRRIHIHTFATDPGPGQVAAPAPPAMHSHMWVFFQLADSAAY